MGRKKSSKPKIADKIDLSPPAWSERDRGYRPQRKLVIKPVEPPPAHGLVIPGLASASPRQDKPRSDGQVLWSKPDYPAPPPVSTVRYDSVDAHRLRIVISEINRRRQEALMLFEPLPKQEEFFRCKARERVYRGGNRGGKTLTGAVECARAVTNQDPHGKWPKKGSFLIVGKDLKHCGDVLFEKMFCEGAFRIIRDELTKEWRAFRPWQAYDKAHSEKSKDAPPLISTRFYNPKSIAWHDKKDRIPKSVRLNTGWTMNFFSSEGDPRQGIIVDGWWFDEEILGRKWYPETSARVMDRKGKGFWTATPQVGTVELLELHDRAEKEQEAAASLHLIGESYQPRIMEFCASLLDNPHIDEEEKKDFIERAKASTEENSYEVRVEGGYAIMGSRVYPECFPKGLHGIEAFPIPHDWTCYYAVDPGVQVCGVLFCACPPPSSILAGKKIIFDELYIPRCTADKFADRLAQKYQERWFYQHFIDLHMGRQTLPTGRTYAQTYQDALAARKIGTVVSGHKFTWANADVAAGIEAVRSWLRIGEDDRPTCLIMYEKCPNMLMEISRYPYKRTPDGITTDVPANGKWHLMDCWRYLATAKLRWVKPKPKEKPRQYAAELLAMKNRKKGDPAASISLG